MKYKTMESPVGPLLIAGDEDGLKFIIFATEKRAADPAPDWEESESSLIREAVRQLTAYFTEELTSFDLPLAPSGTSFQMAVWRELRQIPYGKVISYGELAKRLGKSRAVRAVGAANGANPLPIVIPCHRVIGSNGKLTGYGGGLHIKEALLALERVRIF